MSRDDPHAQLSPQIGLRMIIKCLPESPFKETATRVVDGAVHMMGQQEQRITALVLENQSLNEEIKNLRGIA